ncbi:MAG: M48 family metalloprotease [Desulfosalsimonadaceae bacterium]
MSGYNPVTGENRFYAYSWEEERKIGNKTDKEITAQYGVYPDESLQAYVDRVGQKVLQGSDLRSPEVPARFRETPFTFRVLDSPVVNAFALPGGYIYITRGLLAHLQNEAQLAVVLGHELGHVAARHSSRRALKARIGQAGLLAGTVLGSQVLESPALTRQALNLSSTAMQLLFLKYSRDDERQADRLGVEYSGTAGYCAEEASGFFRVLDRMSEQKGESLPAWQSTHPDPGRREVKVRELAGELSSKEKMTLIRTEEYLSHINGIVLGKDPREGYSEEGYFYHPDMRFKFRVPEGWKVNNQKTIVVLQSPRKDAAITFQLAQGDTAREAARKFSSSKAVQVRRSGSTLVNGRPAYAVTAVAKTRQGLAGIRYYFIEHEGHVFAFGGFTSAENFSKRRATFEQTLRSFSALKDKEKINVSPLRLKLATADRTAEFRTFAASIPGEMTVEEAALLNQTEADAVVEARSRLKLPAR